MPPLLEGLLASEMLRGSAVSTGSTSVFIFHFSSYPVCLAKMAFLGCFSRHNNDREDHIGPSPDNRNSYDFMLGQKPMSWTMAGRGVCSDEMKGRGATENPPNRFEQIAYERDADDPSPKMQFYRDASES